MAESIRNALNLKKHGNANGGYYGECYLDSATLTKGQTNVDWLVEKRACSSHLYFLLVGTNVSKMHRLRCDEGINFYAGNTALLVNTINADGTLTTMQLDPTNFSFYANVPKNSWFGMELANKKPDSYVLFGSTVAPAFDFKEFEVADPETLEKLYPQHTDLIKKFT